MPIIEINDLKTDGLEPFAHLNETQLRHYYEPNGGIFIGESPTVIERSLDAGYEPISLLIEKKFLDTEAAAIIRRCRDIPVYTSTLDVLSDITGYHLTRGILCAFRRKELKTVEQVCKNAGRIVILEDVENPTNVGAVFRSAAALSMDAVLLTAASSDPLYRRAIRVSVGTVFQVPWTYIEDYRHPWPESGIEMLKEMGFSIAAMALKDKTISIDDPVLKSCDRLAVVIGNEYSGITDKTISLCDYTVKIPMSHGVDSLNAAAASAVAFWELGRGRQSE